MTPWPAELPPLPAGTPTDRPVALLLRHAERPAITPGEHGTDLALTAHGRRTAELLGATLGPRILSLSTSPVRRCRQTAEAIRSGANLNLDITPDHLLGDPGVFVSDPDLAWTHWQTLGHEAVVKHLAHADQPLPGLASPDKAAHQLAQHMARSLAGSPPGLHVFVTHDAILYPTIARLLPAPDPQWPKFLESAALDRPITGLAFAYRRDRRSPVHAP